MMHMTVLQCPGCELWQLEYDLAVAQEFFLARIEKDGIHSNFDGFLDALEDVLREHMDHCPPLAHLAREKGVK